MKYVLTVSVVLALAITAHGQQGDDGPHAAAVSGEPRPDPIGQRLEQLRRTAGELERAGELDQAVTVHRQAEDERLALLARLDALETEAEQIRQAVGTGTQVLVHVQVVEVPITKLRALGFAFEKLVTEAPGPAIVEAGADLPKGDARVVTGDGSSVSHFVAAPGIFEALREDKLLKVLAEPTLVTVSGRTAVFESGIVPVPRPQPDGSVTVEQQGATRVEVTPQVLGNRVRLMVRSRLRELNHARSVRIGKQMVPALRVLEFATGAELASGQMLVLAGPTQVREDRERNEVATYVLVRPEIVPQATASHPAVFHWQPFDPASQTLRPTVAPGNAPAATAERSPDGEIRR